MADEKPSSADVDSDQAVFEAAKDKSLRVGRLVVAGLNRTKVEVVDRELRGVREAGTLDEIKVGVQGRCGCCVLVGPASSPRRLGAPLPAGCVAGVI